MLDRTLYLIAGIDGKLIASCPDTDKMWVRQLGYSLCLSFIVVFGVSVYSLGYIIPELWLRIPVALVIALTLFLFDRALFQSDWFTQTAAQDAGAAVQSEAEAGRSLLRFGRIAVRLTISLILASVIASFLELAMFSSTITERIEANRVVANKPLFEKLATFEAGLNAEIEQQSASLTALEQSLQATFAQSTNNAAAIAGLDAIDEQIKALAVREDALLGELKQLEPAMRKAASEMNAEEFGQRLDAESSMRPGFGPRYEFARRQKELIERQIAARTAELAHTRSKQDDLKTARSQLVDQETRQRAAERARLDDERGRIQAQIVATQSSLQQLQASRQPRVDAYWQKLRTEFQYREAGSASDPLTRMAAFEQLKQDPQQGATITMVSWMTRLFIIFLEVVPVVAKIFFSPPSVYAFKIQAHVARGCRRAEAADNNEVIELREDTAPSIVPAHVTGLDAALRGLTALQTGRLYEPERRIEDRRKQMPLTALRGTGKKSVPIPRQTRPVRSSPRPASTLLPV